MIILAYQDEEDDFDDDQDQDTYNQQSAQDNERDGPDRNGQWCSCRRHWADWRGRWCVNHLHDYADSQTLCP